MREKFIEFRLCEGNWKVEKYGSIKFSDWIKGHARVTIEAYVMNLLHHNEMICLSNVGDNPSVNAKDANRKRKRREDDDSDNPERSRKKVKKHRRVRLQSLMSLSSDSEDDENLVQRYAS